MERNVVRDLLVGCAAMRLIPHRLRGRILSIDPAISIAADARLLHGVELTGRGRIVIGRSFLNSHCFIDGTGDVTIGNAVLLAHRVAVLTATHESGPSQQRGRKPQGLSTVIEDGCWIGAGAIILPGVRVGMGCIVAAGAVVTQDCEPDGLYAGVPAVRKKDLPV
jgi:maltose O-acetyltransferase